MIVDKKCKKSVDILDLCSFICNSYVVGLLGKLVVNCLLPKNCLAVAMRLFATILNSLKRSFAGAHAESEF